MYDSPLFGLPEARDVQDSVPVSLLPLPALSHLISPPHRAIFVHNCTTDFGQELHMPQSKGRAKEAAAKRAKKRSPQQEAGSSGSEQAEAAASVNNKYYSVKCDVCSTSVAVYDQDEVYHFFNVLSSHS